MPIAEVMNDRRRPSFSMLYHVPNEATRNQIWRKPDIRRAKCRSKPTEFSNLDKISMFEVDAFLDSVCEENDIHDSGIVANWCTSAPCLAGIQEACEKNATTRTNVVILHQIYPAFLLTFKGQGVLDLCDSDGKVGFIDYSTRRGQKPEHFCPLLMSVILEQPARSYRHESALLATQLSSKIDWNTQTFWHK